MKRCCRRMKPTESINEVKQRHCNFVNWLKLLFETITIFGNEYTTNSQPIYHGLDVMFNFSEIKATFCMPISATTDLQVARTLTGSGGDEIVVQFSGFDSTGRTRYFDTSSLSASSYEKEYLFFFAELCISGIIIGPDECSTAPLALYESIVTGCNIVEKVQVKQKPFRKIQIKLFQYWDNENYIYYETQNKAEKLCINMFKKYRAKSKNIYINPDIINKIKHKKLKQKLLKQNANKQKREIYRHHRGYYFKWEISKEEIDEWKSEWKSDVSLISEPFECDEGKVKFYVQLNYVDKIKWKGENGYETLECYPFGRVTLFLYQMPDGLTTLHYVSFDIYCKKLGKYYSRFEHIDFDISEEGLEMERNYQGESFDINLLDVACKKSKNITWEFTIRYPGFSFSLSNEKQNVSGKMKVYRKYEFKWVIDKDEFDEWKSEWKDNEPLPSESYECDEGKTVFHAEMDYVDKIESKSENGYETHECDPFGRITLLLYKLKDQKTKLDNVSFDIYCKKMDKYYVRIENIDFDISDEGIENEKNYHSQSFDINLLTHAFENHTDIEWQFSIQYGGLVN
eukprot:438725_1